MLPLHNTITYGRGKMYMVRKSFSPELEHMIIVNVCIETDKWTLNN